MHYRNGREAHNGDLVVQLDDYNHAIKDIGRLHNCTPGNDYCNGAILPLNGGSGATACMCDCLHMDDVWEMLAQNGWDKRPDGK